MVIRTNVKAKNAYRQLNRNSGEVTKSLEKLASGLRINRAADDAAGLAISEKMKAQITALEAASGNAQDGISLIQTAEGNLNEVHDMLNRMIELSAKAANGTFSEMERTALQQEMDQLLDEVDRIAKSANFNGRKLLDGSMADKAVITPEKVVDVTPVLDGKQSEKEVLGQFVLDLSQAEWTNTAADTQKIVLNLGGLPLIVGTGTDSTMLSIAAGATVTGKEAADIIYNNFPNNFQRDGVEYNIENDGSGRLTFTQKTGKDLIAVVTPPDQFKLEFKWDPAAGSNEYTVGAGGAVTEGIKCNQGQVQAVTVLRNGVAAGERLYAQGTFALGPDIVKDGGALQIGDTTYVFAVGPDSKYKDQANVIDLTDKRGGDADLCAEAAQRLSAAAENNKNFFVETDANTATVFLTEKEGGVDYQKNNLSGEDGLATYDKGYANVDSGKDWKGLVQFGMIDLEKSTAALTLQIGDSSDSINKMTVSVGDMSVEGLGLSALKGDGIMTEEGASSAIDTVKEAVNTVSTARASLGALQNRLEHTINNLDVSAENLSASNSRIRDTDMAEEMMNYTKMNILLQSAQAMLAQANQEPQSVLQLLQ